MQHNPDGTLKMVQVRAGPCDGREVPMPPLGDMGKQHAIAITAPPEMQSVSEPGSMYCFYLWMVRKQQYWFVDSLRCADNRAAEVACHHVAGDVPTPIGKG